MPRRIARELRQVLARCAGVDGPIPWVDAGVAARAIELGLASVVDAALRNGRARSTLDDARRDALVRAADLETALVLAAEDEALRVVRRLRAEGIAAVALKGLVANARLHRPRGWCRAPGDVDLLVPAEAAADATRLFLDDPDYEAHGALGPAFYREHHHTRPFARRGRHAVPVELHRRLSGATTGGLRIDLEGCWRRAVPFPELGPDVARLDDVDQFLATVVHVDRDDAYRERARQLFDLALWWDHCAARRGEIETRAREWNLAPTLERVLQLLDAFLDADVTGVERAGVMRRALWTPVALDLTMGSGTENALPAWYRQGVFRAVTHEKGLRGILAAVTDPLWRRTGGSNGTSS